jgi:hypothetical protein
MLFVVADPEVRYRRYDPRGCVTRAGGIFMFFAAFMLGLTTLVIAILVPGMDVSREEQKVGLTAIAWADNFARGAVDDLPPADLPIEEGPIYAVQPLANVDSLTAKMTLESILNEGFSGFVMDGSDSEGYDVYLPGLEFDEAVELELLLKGSGIIPEYGWLPEGFYVVEGYSLR